MLNEWDNVQASPCHSDDTIFSYPYHEHDVMSPPQLTEISSLLPADSVDSDVTEQSNSFVKTPTTSNTMPHLKAYGESDSVALQAYSKEASKRDSKRKNDSSLIPLHPKAARTCDVTETSHTPSKGEHKVDSESSASCSTIETKSNVDSTLPSSQRPLVKLETAGLSFSNILEVNALTLGTITESLAALDASVTRVKSEVDGAKVEAKTQAKITRILGHCRVCKEEFPQLTLLQKHYQDVHPNEKMYKCDFCPEQFDTKHELAKHCLVHVISDQGEKCVCTTCWQAYGTPAELKAHRRSKTGFQCKVCSKVLSKHSRLAQHMNTHTGRTPYECRLCGDRFTKFTAFNKHRQICGKSDVVVPKHVCSHCGKAFKSKSHLVRHELSHSDTFVRPQCDICQAKFYDKSGLNRHRKIHTGEKCICPLCGGTYASRDALTAHTNAVHKKLQPFSCSYCARKFSTKEACKTHERVHTNERPLKCPHCGDGFRNRSSLNAHKNKHIY